MCYTTRETIFVYNTSVSIRAARVVAWSSACTSRHLSIGMTQRWLINVAVFGLAAFLLVYAAAGTMQSRETVLSRWGVALPAALAGAADTGGLVGHAEPLSAKFDVVSTAPPGEERLAAFNGGSVLQESAGAGSVEFYRRTVGGGELLYTVARLDEAVHVEVINADGALPTSDAGGDTMWADGQRHLRPVVEMANAPYAVRDGLELLWAMAFGFHGDARTSNEGSVVINGVVHRVNAGRGALCISADGRAWINKFNHDELGSCEQAVGGGPVILWHGKIANSAVAAETDEFVPFNPLGEDFAQLDWRILVYNGGYPKTAVCVGDLANGRSFLVLANSNGIAGIDFARSLRDLGCHTALGGDDDTSTQAVWRGQALWSRPQRPVPDAIAVYLRR